MPATSACLRVRPPGPRARGPPPRGDPAAPRASRRRGRGNCARRGRRAGGDFPRERRHQQQRRLPGSGAAASARAPRDLSDRQRRRARHGGPSFRLPRRPRGQHRRSHPKTSRAVNSPTRSSTPTVRSARTYWRGACAIDGVRRRASSDGSFRHARPWPPRAASPRAAGRRARAEATPRPPASAPPAAAPQRADSGADAVRIDAVDERNHGLIGERAPRAAGGNFQKRRQPPRWIPIARSAGGAGSAARAGARPRTDWAAPITTRLFPQISYRRVLRGGSRSSGFLGPEGALAQAAVLNHFGRSMRCPARLDR